MVYKIFTDCDYEYVHLDVEIDLSEIRFNIINHKEDKRAVINLRPEEVEVLIKDLKKLIKEINKEINK